MSEEQPESLPEQPREPEVLAPDAKIPGDEERPRFNLEVASENVSEVMDKLRGNVQYWVDRGRYNKVRIKRQGKPVLPDIPVGALMAFEAATFFWSGLLRGVIVNVVGRAFFEVELINEAEEHYKRGLENFLGGDLDEANASLEKALRIDPRYARAHLQLGVVRKMQGRKAEAQAHFEEAIVHDEKRDVRKEAEIHLKRMREAN